MGYQFALRPDIRTLHAISKHFRSMTHKDCNFDTFHCESNSHEIVKRKDLTQKCTSRLLRNDNGKKCSMKIRQSSFGLIAAFFCHKAPCRWDTDEDGAKERSRGRPRQPKARSSIEELWPPALAAMNWPAPRHRSTPAMEPARARLSCHQAMRKMSSYGDILTEMQARELVHAPEQKDGNDTTLAADRLP